MTAHTKRACPSCKSSWTHRKQNTKVYTCQNCNHVFTADEAWVPKPEATKTSGSGQKAGPVVIGKMMMNWGSTRRNAG